jgi:hypothetical protein
MTDDRSLVSGPSAQHSDRAGPSARPHLSLDPSRAPPLLLAERNSRGGRTVLSRPAILMAEFYHGEDGNTGRGTTFACILRSVTDHSQVSLMFPYLALPCGFLTLRYLRYAADLA